MGRKAKLIAALNRRPGRSQSQLIRAYRERSHLTIRQLADRAFLPAEVVEAIELGLYRTTTTEVWQLAKALSVKPLWLVYDINPDLL